MLKSSSNPVWGNETHTISPILAQTWGYNIKLYALSLLNTLARNSCSSCDKRFTISSCKKDFKTCKLWELLVFFHIHDIIKCFSRRLHTKALTQMIKSENVSEILAHKCYFCIVYSRYTIETNYMSLNKWLYQNTWYICYKT